MRTQWFRLVLAFSLSGLIAELLSPQVLRDDGTVWVDGLHLKAQSKNRIKAWRSSSEVCEVWLTERK